MATIIDSLVVEFGLDASEFDKNSKHIADELKRLREGVDIQGRMVVDSNRRMGDSFHALRLNIVSAIAAFVGARGISEFIASSITGQAELGRLSRNLDINARRLDAWGTVAEEVGGKAQDSFAALQSVAAGLAEAAIEKHSALTDTARANGIALNDARGQMVSSEEALIRFSARMQSLPRQHALWLANRAGIGGMFNELMLGPDQLRARLAEAEQLSRVSQVSTERAEQLQRQWALLRARFSGIGQNVFAKLEPVLMRLADRFAAFIDSVDWDKVSAGVEKFVGQVVILIAQVDRGAAAMGGWKTVLEVLAGLFAVRLLSPLLGVVGALGRLAGLGGGVSSALGSITGSVRGLGVALGAMDLTALAGVTGALGLAYSPAAGGSKRADGSYEDEAARPTGAAPGTDNANLWAAVYGNPTKYRGSPEQAATLLAHKFYVDNMDDASYQQVAQQILSAQMLPVDATATGAAIKDYSTLPGSGSDTDQLFATIEKKYGLPAGLINRVYQKESGGGRNLISPAGALGPFQFMPGTARELGLSDADVFDTGKSGDAAGRYLSQLNRRFGGDWHKTLAAYNWGAGNVQRYGLEGAPTETRNYMKMADGLPIGAAASMPTAAQAGQGASSTEVSINKIEIHTQATDAAGIASAIRPAIRQQMVVNGFNGGQE